MEERLNFELGSSCKIGILAFQDLNKTKGDCFLLPQFIHLPSVKFESVLLSTQKFSRLAAVVFVGLVKILQE